MCLAMQEVCRLQVIRDGRRKHLFLYKDSKSTLDQKK
uniref:Uncharacterized protein n=1 Tax=Anguilla anguilla TaxID=7936 RepID=A0A0E9UZA7_ANGAN